MGASSPTPSSPRLDDGSTWVTVGRRPAIIDDSEIRGGAGRELPGSAAVGALPSRWPATEVRRPFPAPRPLPPREGESVARRRRGTSVPAAARLLECRCVARDEWMVFGGESVSRLNGRAWLSRSLPRGQSLGPTTWRGATHRCSLATASTGAGRSPVGEALSLTGMANLPRGVCAPAHRALFRFGNVRDDS